MELYYVELYYELDDIYDSSRGLVYVVGSLEFSDVDCLVWHYRNFFFNFNTVSLENSGKVGILGNWGLMLAIAINI